MGLSARPHEAVHLMGRITDSDPFATLHWALVRLLVVAAYKPVAKPIFAWLDKRAEIKGQRNG
jgi:hypothetical protein